jgi:hypothetical protein
MSAAKKTNKGSGRKRRDKDALPVELPLSSARRATEEALRIGYALGVVEMHKEVIALILKGQSREVIDEATEAYKKFRRSSDFTAYIEKMTALAHKFVEELLAVEPEGGEIIDDIIKQEHAKGLNKKGRSPLPESLVTAAAKRKRRSRPLKSRR